MTVEMSWWTYGGSTVGVGVIAFRVDSDNPNGVVISVPPTRHRASNGPISARPHGSNPRPNRISSNFIRRTATGASSSIS